MTSVSASSRLDVVNAVLGNVGERTVSTTVGSVSPTVVKVLNAIKTALTEIESANDWLFLRVRRNATSWTGEKAQIGVDVRKLIKVEYSRPNYVPYELRWIQWNIFSEIPLKGYTDLEVASRYPQYFSVSEMERVSITPYPSGSLGQSYIFFLVNIGLTFPLLDADVFNMPENVIQLLILRASYHMAIRHNNELNTAQAFDLAYRQLLIQLMSFYRGTVPSQSNMFKPERFHGYYSTF